MSSELEQAIKYTKEVMKAAGSKRGKDSPQYKQQAEKLKILESQLKSSKKKPSGKSIGSSSKKTIVDQIKSATTNTERADIPQNVRGNK